MIQNINISTPNDGLGDTLRAAFNKVNENFTELLAIDSSFSGEIDSITASLALIDAALSGKSDINHTHVISGVTGLQAALDGKVDVSTFNTQIAAINDSIADINSALINLVEEAPQNGIQYARKDGGWTQVTGGGGGTGSPIFFDFRFDTSTTASDPSAGKFRFNSVTQSATTQIFIDQFNNEGDDFDFYFTKLTPDWVIFIQDKDDSSKRFIFDLSGSTDNSGWWTFYGTMIESTVAQLGNNAICTLAFQKINQAPDVYVTGGTYSNGTASFTNSTGGTFPVTGFFTGDTEVYVTGGVPNNTTRQYSFSYNTGGTFNVDSLLDIHVTGGTPNNSTRQYVFTNNSGDSFNVNSLLDVYVTGGTPNNSTRKYVFTNNSGDSFNVDSLLDVYVTGATFTDIHNVRYSNNSGTSFNVNGFVSTAQTVTVNGVTKNLSGATREWITSQASTGVLNFAGISAGTATTIKIPAITGMIVDNESVIGVSNPQLVSYSGNSAVTVTTLGSGTQSYALLNSSGQIYFQNTLPTSAERKTNIWLGKIGHPLGTITVVLNEPDYVISPNSKINDLFQAIVYINDGIFASPNGTNLSFNISAGNIHGNGINYHVDRTTPNEVTMGPLTPAPFLYRTMTGGTSGAVTLIDPTQYDVAGTITPVGGGFNTSTIQYIFCVPAAGFIVQYGQNTYPSLNDAIAAIGKETFIPFPNLEGNALLIGVLAVKRTATNLADTSQGQFFRSDKFGQIIGAVGGTSTGTLQSSYNNSVQPQITTTSLLGAVQIKGYDNGAKAFEVLSSGGTSVFGVSDLGVVTGTSFVKSGGTSSQYLMADGSVSVSSSSLFSAGTGTGSIKAIQNPSSPNNASGAYSFAVGNGTHSSGVTSFACGSGTTAQGNHSHAEGGGAQAKGTFSHAEGSSTIALGEASHAEGASTQANGPYSHAEGYLCFAAGQYSHAEGQNSQSNGFISHAQGDACQANGTASHAGGASSVANGITSFVHGEGNQADGDASVVIGGNGILGTQNNTVYVPNLVIKRADFVPTAVNDTNGESGNISWDDSYLYVKTANGWGRIILDFAW